MKLLFCQPWSNLMKTRHEMAEIINRKIDLTKRNRSILCLYSDLYFVAGKRKWRARYRELCEPQRRQTVEGVRSAEWPRRWCEGTRTSNCLRQPKSPLVFMKKEGFASGTLSSASFKRRLKKKRKVAPWTQQDAARDAKGCRSEPFTELTFSLGLLLLLLYIQGATHDGWEWVQLQLKCCVKTRKEGENVLFSINSTLYLISCHFLRL